MGSLVYVFSRQIERGYLNFYYPETPKNFGEHLRKLRMDAGLTGTQLAKMLGVNRDTVYNWEVKGRKPSPDYQARIDDLLANYGAI
jgi:DNA-binding XRE family transcriptional regulator